MLGIDVYERYQDVTDWSAVARHGVRFCWAKASDGGSVVAPANRADAIVAGARSVGIRIGLYHFAQFNPSPEQQADVLMGEVRRLRADSLPPALDLEAPFVPDARARDFAIRFLRRLRDHHGIRPAVYGNTSMFAGIRPDTWDIPGLAIWAADYGPNDGRRHPDLRPYPGRADVHQYTSRGRVPGISGFVDLNESLTDFINREDNDMAGELADQIMQFMIDRLSGLPDGHQFKGKHVGDMLLDATGYANAADTRAQRLEAAAQRIETALADLTARPPADVDEAALAAELAARGIGGATPQQVKEAVRAAFARAGQPDQETTR